MLRFLRHTSILAVILMVAIGVSYSPVYAQDDHAKAAEESHDHDADQKDHANENGDHSSEEHGAGHGGEHRMPPLLSFDIGSAFCNLVIFLTVLAILSKFVWPQILEGLESRDEKIRSDLENAEKANTEAKALLTDYQAKLDSASSEVQSMLADARRDAEASGQRIVDEAKAEAARQADRALAEIETAKKVALADLAGQTSDMAIGVAKQIVGRELKVEDHQELIRQSLDRLPSKN